MEFARDRIELKADFCTKNSGHGEERVRVVERRLLKTIPTPTRRSLAEELARESSSTSFYPDLASSAFCCIQLLYMLAHAFSSLVCSSAALFRGFKSGLPSPSQSRGRDEFVLVFGHDTNPD
eukprot:3813064-Rhodomonas_salina.1